MYEKLPLSLRKALYPLQLKIRAIRQRRLDEITSSAMTRALDTVASKEPSIRKHLFYGASAINSRHLVTWYIFQTDRELETARQNGLTLDLETLTRSELVKRGYPEKGAELMHVSFTSEEDVQNKTGGCTPRDYFYYFK
jgi:hypothetical protein